MLRKPRAFSILTIQNQSRGNCLCKNNARCISLSPRCMSLGKLKKTAAPEQHQRLRNLLSPRRRVRFRHKCCGSPALFGNKINNAHKCFSSESRVVRVGLSLALRLPVPQESARAEEYEWTSIPSLKESNTSTTICPHLSAPLFDMAGAALGGRALIFSCFYNMKRGANNSAGTFPCK